MKKASELRAQLKKGGFGPEDTERIVKGEILAKTCEDDGLLGSISVEALIAASDELRKGVIENPLDAARTSDAIAKGGSALAEDVSDMLRATTANTESLVDYIGDAVPKIAKGVYVQGQALEGIIGALTSLDTIVKGMQAQLAAPVGPRGVRPDTEPQLGPADRTKPPAEGDKQRPTRKQVIDGLRRQRQDLIKKGGGEEDVDRIGKAIGMLENSAVPTGKILAAHDIEITV